MADKFVKASKSFNKFLKPVVRFYLNRIFELEYDVKNISDLKPPYFVIANHVNFWDPFIVSLCVPEPIYFIASDAYFRSRILKRLLRLVGAIPKIKFVNDAKAIRSVLEVRKNNGIIGLFPEGRRNWDGRTLPLLHASAKLVKSMKIPVISLRLEGACLAFPRWAATPRKGKIKVVGSLLLDGSTLPEITVDQIYEKMTQALENDEYGRQRQQMNIYKGKRLAERLELFLFTCPDCHAIGSMKSNNDTFECKECGYKVRYDEYGFIKKVHKYNDASAEDSNISEYFDTTQEWNNWQLGYLTQFITERIKYIDVPLFQDTGISVFTGERFKPLKPVASGILTLYPDRLFFKGNSGFSLTCPISHINGENIQFNNRLEFYCDKVLYRFSRPNMCLSAYKWVKAIEIAKNISNKGECL